MAGLPRPTSVAPSRKQSMKPPSARPSTFRSQSVAPAATRSGAVSPAESVTSIATNATGSNAGTKRKERDFEHEGGEETNINVVVRCRGRNEREVRENSGVVLSTDGVKGKTVELSMGPSALSNKTYHFDKVFSPAADQSMIFDDVVTPILEEMLSGFNCTIFAYGQTGTGKTYTMSGDMKDTMGMLSDAAGIIPRALHALFNKLEIDDAESSVKCSFIELYNEELRDLISPEENSRLKIFEDTNKKGHTSTVVQGMEESYIKSASEGVKLLQDGSHRRQVAATKCNDLSSRSHTVFTVTAYIKRTTDSGEDYISAGKLNLVDLAGSENIQRSGAENKRAAEAGLINKSLLTLGRVINALVDKSSHIPYRESKLTRLLQDSLGGRTKTCIIATVSPAKSNLEETISTLDYAFRAKNIRNKPQLNQMINKKALLRDFANEIEKLKGELIATRQKNGVYLTNESYEEISAESESRRILSEEQAAKIETLETNLRNKVQELFTLTSNFLTLKKDHEGTRASLDETKNVLEQTEIVLADTRQSLAEEEMLRKAHQQTEEQLNSVGTELISTLEKTVSDVSGLHSKLRRRSDLQSMNRNTWGLTQAQVSEATELVETRIEEFQTEQQRLMSVVSSRMQSFVQEELEKLTSTQAFLEEHVAAFKTSENEVSQQTSQAKDTMDQVLEEIKTLREDVKARVGEGLQGLSAAAERISAEVLTELGAFHTQLHGSYSSLGRDFKNMFEELIKHINAQKTEAEELRQQLAAASEAAMQANSAASSRLEAILTEEREQAAVERQDLLSQITNLITAQGEVQDARWKTKITQVQSDITSCKETFETSKAKYSEGMDSWNEKEGKLVEEVLRSRETLKSKLKEDWVAANKHNATIQTATKSVHEETIRIVDEQMKDISNQMQALDDFVTRARSQNAQHHDVHTISLQGLSDTVKTSYTNIGSHFTSTYERVKDLGDEMSTKTATLREALEPLDATLRQPLAELRAHIAGTQIQEYQPTGETPQKIQYLYPTELPRTDAHENLLAVLRGNGRPTTSSSSASVSVSPSKITMVFQDAPSSHAEALSSNTAHNRLPPSSTSAITSPVNTTTTLRELDANVLAASISEHATTTNINTNSSAPNSAGGSSTSDDNTTSSGKQQILFKRSVISSIPPTALSSASASSGVVSGLKPPAKIAKKSMGSVLALEGRENVNPSLVPVLSQSVGSGGAGRRRSPRNL